MTVQDEEEEKLDLESQARSAWRKESQQRLAAMVHTAREEGEEDNMVDGTIRPEELLQLREEAERVIEETLRIYETRFANIPQLQRLRILWQERRIEEHDPVFLMIEGLSLVDARSQLQLAQVVRIMRAYENLTQYTAKEMRGMLNEVLQIRQTTEPLLAAMLKVTKEAQGLAQTMEKFAALAPELMEVVQAAIQLQNRANVKTRITDACIYAGLVALGFLLHSILR